MDAEDTDPDAKEIEKQDGKQNQEGDTGEKESVEGERKQNEQESNENENENNNQKKEDEDKNKQKEGKDQNETKHNDDPTISETHSALFFAKLLLLK